MRRILIISALLLAVVFSVTADRRRMLLARNVAAGASVPTPIFRLEMNEGTGSTTADSSGNGNTFNITGATWITGKSGSGGALQFDGVNDFAVSAANLSPLTDSTNYTFCAWVWWDTFANDDDLLCELSSNANNNDGAFLIDPNASSPSGLVSISHQDSTVGSRYRAEEAARWPAAEWVHVAAVFEGRANSNLGEWTLYTNGVVATTSVTSGPTAKDQTSDLFAAPFYLMSRGGTILFAAGRLDDVGLWGSALDSTTINTIRNQSR